MEDARNEETARNRMMTYPRISTVTPVSDFKLIVSFSNGIKKEYDCSHLLVEKAFEKLRDPRNFGKVVKEKSGFAVIWDEDTDLAESELWINGKEI